MELSSGEYIIKTNQEQNQFSFSTDGPLLYVEENPTKILPIIDQLENIEITEGEGDLLHYFYNWKVTTSVQKECVDGFYDVEFKMVTSVEDRFIQKVKYNSLVSDVLTMELEGNHKFRIHDSRGVLIASGEFSERGEYVMGNYSAGLYYLIIEQGVYKIVKQ